MLWRRQHLVTMILFCVDRRQDTIWSGNNTFLEWRLRLLRLCNHSRSQRISTNPFATAVRSLQCFHDVMWLSSPRSKAQASGQCCTRITLLIFSPPEGYRLQFSIPHAYFVYTIWHCTGQHCSSICVCTYRLFAGTWRPLVSVITTLYYTMLHVCMLFHWIVQRIFNKIKVQASSSRPRLPLG